MTQPHPQPHCDHECVCPDYRASNSECDEEDPDPCTIPCMQRATHPAAPATEPNPCALCPYAILCSECDLHRLAEKARKAEREHVLDELILMIKRKEGCGYIFMDGPRFFTMIESLRGGAL